MYFEPRDGSVARPPAAARDELLLLLVFAPLLVSDIRAPVSRVVTACDASPWACAGVETELAESVVRELWRFRDRKGGYVRCETPFEALVRDTIAAGTDADIGLFAEAVAEEGAALFPSTAHERQFGWVSELADAVGWSSQFRYRAKLSDHINLKEARAYRTVVRRKAGNALEHSRRHLTLQDSAVVRGATAKGRSSSRRLNAFLRPAVPEQLAANLTFGSLPVPTKHNPADAPTRDVPVRRKPATVCPSWLADLAQGDYSAWDARYGAGPCAPPAALFPVADKAVRPVPPPTRRFDSTLGYPGEGPADRRCVSAKVARRASADIRGSRASPEERARRAAAVVDFQSWLVECDIPAAAVDRFSGEDLASLLVEYGQAQFRKGASVNALRNATFGITDRRNGLRPAMKPVWNAVSNWEREEPAESHVPLPAVAYAAALTVCIAWRWWEMLAALIAGWLSLARPGELMRLRRKDLILPSDLGQDRVSSPGFIVFRHPKGSWGRNAARVEHVRVSDRDGLAFLEAYAAAMPDEALLFPTLSVGVRFRTSWDSVFGSLGFACRDIVGLTPASLRAGAGTDLYVRTNDPSRFQWLARHTDPQTARRYLQEHAAALVYARLPHAHKSRIQSLAGLAPALLPDAAASLQRR